MDAPPKYHKLFEHHGNRVTHAIFRVVSGQFLKLVHVPINPGYRFYASLKQDDGFIISITEVSS